MRFIFYWGLDMIKICVPTEVELKIFITVCVLGYVLRFLLTPMTDFKACMHAWRVTSSNNEYSTGLWGSEVGMVEVTFPLLSLSLRICFAFFKTF